MFKMRRSRGKVRLAGDVGSVSRFHTSIGCRKKKSAGITLSFFNESEFRSLQDILKIKISKSYISKSTYLKREHERKYSIHFLRKKLLIFFEKVYEYFNFKLFFLMFDETFPSAS